MRPARDFRYSVPSREDVAERLAGLIRGELARADVADWASEFLTYDDPHLYPEVSDRAVWRALQQLSGTDLPTSDRDYLYDEDDFAIWLRELRDRSGIRDEVTTEIMQRRDEPRGFGALRGRWIESWSAQEMALRDGEPTLGASTFHDPEVPFLQLGILHIGLEGGEVLAVTTVQDDTHFSLAIAPAHGALTPTSPEGIYRNRHLDELPCTRISRVDLQTDTAGRIAQVDLDLDDGSQLALVAGEVYEDWDGRLRFLRDDESVLLFPRRADVPRIDWASPPVELPDGVRNLAAAWCLARPLTADLESLQTPPPLPQELARTLTCRQPWRAQLEKDARMWLALPQPVALGTEMHVQAANPVSIFECWQESIGPLELRLEGRDRMDAWQAEPVLWRHVWQRVALEHGEWRLVQLLDDRDRAELSWYRDCLIWMKEGQQGDPPPPPRSRSRSQPRRFIERVRAGLRAAIRTIRS